MRFAKTSLAVGAFVLVCGARGPVSSALASGACPPPNAPADTPTGGGIPLNPTPGNGGPAITGGGGSGGPVTPGGLPGRQKGRVPDLPGATTQATTGTTGWTRWWDRNKDIYLRFAPLRTIAVVTPDGDATSSTPVATAPLLRDDLLPLFLAAAEDPEPQLRLTAVMALGRAGGSEDAAGLLRRAARADRIPVVRESAYLALGLLGRTEDIPWFSEQLNDRNLDARTRAFSAFSLGLIGGDDASDELARFVAGARRIGSNREELDCAAVLALGLTRSKWAGDTLLDVAKDTRFRGSVRASAITSLGRLKEPRAVALTATELHKSKDAEIRSAAAQALGALAEPRDADLVDLLVRAATDDDTPAVRHFALISLGRIGGVRTSDRLQVIFRKAKGDDRAFAAIALGLTREKSALPLLRDAVEEERSEADRSAFCLSLGLLGHIDAAPVLEAQLDGKSSNWHHAYAATALALLGDATAAPAIRERLLSCRDVNVRRHLGVALGYLGDEGAAVALAKRMDASGNNEDRAAAAMAAGVLRIPSLVPQLVGYVKDRREAEVVRGAALAALARMSDPDAVPELARIVAEDDYTRSLEPVDRVFALLDRR
jgi:HEAT repeat protein